MTVKAVGEAFLRRRTAPDFTATLPCRRGFAKLGSDEFLRLATC